MSDDDGLTVRQLIERLQSEPPDALVELEGCDCVNLCTDVDAAETNPNDGSVAIRLRIR